MRRAKKERSPWLRLNIYRSGFLWGRSEAWVTQTYAAMEYVRKWSVGDLRERERKLKSNSLCIKSFKRISQWGNTDGIRRDEELNTLGGANIPVQNLWLSSHLLVWTININIKTKDYVRGWNMLIPTGIDAFLSFDGWNKGTIFMPHIIMNVLMRKPE